MALGRIKTKSVFDDAEKSDGFRILVTRYHPRIKGFKKGIGYDEWLKGVSPIGQAVKMLKSGKMTERKFSKQYLVYLNSSSDAQRDLEHVRELLINGCSVTLLCYEPEGKEFCHRHLLKEYLMRQLNM